MRRLTFLLLATIVANVAIGQNLNLRGAIRDTTEKKNLTNAVITLLQKADSTLVSFTRTDAEGKFVIPKLSPGKYVVLITFPKFADFADEVELKDSDLDMGSVSLTPKSLLLNEVIVRTAAAIRIKGDTTEFTADSFVVKEGATVEDLMKKLPGFQVNSKGEITTQGKRVDKVLVDGEEFFGDDPTMATQNLSAKIVDKVQVFDTKTDQQNLTGITSSNEGKTVNIKLKEDKKKGAFGKLTAGSDFDNVVDAKGLYNRFTGKKKVSLYGTKSNLNTGSLNWEDRQKLGMEEDMEYDEIGGYYFSFGSDDGFSDWSLRGLPNSYTAGGLFSNKWNADKQSVNTSYRFNRLGTDNIASTLTQLIRKDAVNYQNNFTNSTGLNQQHALNGKYEWKVDSLSTIKLTTSGLRKTTDLFSTSATEFFLDETTLSNRSDQRRESHTTRLQTDNQLSYKQLFKKKNRQLLANFRFGIVDDDQESMLYTDAKFFKNGVQDSAGIVDQMKTFLGKSTTLGGKVTFSEPLNNKWNLVLDYGYNNNHSESYRNTFNKTASGKYDALDVLFSNNFDFTAASHSGSTILRFVDKKVRAAIGSGISSVRLNLFNVDDKSRNIYEFLRLTPQTQISYTFKPQTSISFNYRGTTRQPTINQLQPIRDNSNPLNIFQGNPDLKVGFSHNLSTFFNQYKTLSQRSIWINFSYNITNNAIVNSTVFDPVRGKQFYTFVNANGVHNWNFWGNWNKGGSGKKLGYGFRLNGNGGRSINFIDGDRNMNTYATIRTGFSLNMDRENKHGFEFRPEVGYNQSQSSLRKSVNNNYFTYGGWASAYVILPGKVELRTNANFDLRQRIDAFATNTNIILWYATISKKVLKDNSGKLSLVSSDLLNQNRGFNRNISSSFITEERYSRLGQYFLLQFEWTFNKMPGAK